MARLNEADEWGPDEEARLRASWVTEPPRLTGPVVVADYDPAWPGLFEREAARIRALLGGQVRLLEHVGSTSVPGLAAKRVLDMLLVVDDPADEDAYVMPLEGAGYRLVIREPDWHQHRAFKGPAAGAGIDSINLHVHPADSPEIGRILRFRDHLRAHPADRELYQRTKRELATRDWTYMQQYADAKSQVVEDILSRC
jgi:GrpB-like predicted nucleotidyltransferase (UPF0157 family)